MKMNKAFSTATVLAAIDAVTCQNASNGIGVLFSLQSHLPVLAEHANGDALALSGLIGTALAGIDRSGKTVSQRASSAMRELWDQTCGVKDVESMTSTLAHHPVVILMVQAAGNAMYYEFGKNAPVQDVIIDTGVFNVAHSTCSFIAEERWELWQEAHVWPISLVTQWLQRLAEPEWAAVVDAHDGVSVKMVQSTGL